MLNRLNPMFEEDGQGGGAATFEINGQQMTAEQVADAYKKLQADHTKVTQKNSEYTKNEEKVKDWLKFDEYLDDLSTKTGENVKPQVGRMIDSFVESLASGKAPTNAQMANLDKEKDKAEAKGDDATVKKLEALETVVMEQEFEKNLASIEKEAEADDVPYDREEFLAFADEWLEDMGVGDNDEFDLKLLRKAYQAYEAKKLKEESRRVPPLGTSGGASGPDKGKAEKVGGLKGAAAKASQFLTNGR